MTTRTGPESKTESMGRPIVSAGGCASETLGETGLLQSLRNQIRHLETAARCDDGTRITTGCRDLDRLLPGGGLSGGTITEWLAPTAGSGAEILSLIAARQACQNASDCQNVGARKVDRKSSAGRRSVGRSRGALVVIDLWRQFYPPAAAAWGINLDNTIVLRGKSDSRPGASTQEFYWAIDQALRCPAVAAVWGRLDQISERWFRRFQLSAEQSGALGMFVRPAGTAGQPSWSEVQWLVSGSAVHREPAAGPAVLPSVGGAQRQPPEQLSSSWMPRSFSRRVHLKLLRCRGGRAGAQATVQIDFTTGKLQTVSSSDETHSVHLATQLAHPTPRRRSQRA